MKSSLLASLLELEASIKDTLSINQIEMELESICQEAVKGSEERFQLLMYRNQFRVKFADKLKIRKPRIMLGTFSYSSFPNFQTLPFLEFADVVTLCDASSQKGRSYMIPFSIAQEQLSDAIERLPLGFVPDYFFESQICGAAVPIIGLEESPFPTVAGVCHTFRGVNTDYLARLYDVITPVSKGFVELFRRSHPNKQVIDVPFGANWGSFHETLIASNRGWQEREIDLLVSFGECNRYEYGNYRTQALSLARAFANKYKEKYNVVFLSGVDKNTYYDALQRSKVGLNVVGINGPYNYRTCEVINCGALLLQMETEFPIEHMEVSDYLTQGEEYISFTPETFETVLIAILENQDKTVSIAAAGKKRLENDYSYKNIHGKIISAISNHDIHYYQQKRAPSITQFENWMRALNTAHPSHTFKRLLFAKNACSLDKVDDAQLARILLVALPELFALCSVEEALQSISDIELRQASNQSLLTGIEYLYSLLPDSERTIADLWQYQCYQAVYGTSNKEALNQINTGLSTIECSEKTCPDTDQWFTLHFNIDINEWDWARKEILEIPYLQAAGDRIRQRQAIVEYMLWWCNYFITKK